MPSPPAASRVPAPLRIGVALTASLLFTACGGSGELRVGGVETPAEDPSASSPEISEPPELPTEEPELPTEEPTEAPSDLDQPLTSPGTELVVTDPAVLPAQTLEGGGRGVVSFTVTDVTRPAPGELDAKSQDSTLLVYFEVEALQGADQLAGWSPGSDLAGVDARGAFLGAIAVVGGLDSCPRLEVPPGWTEGESLTGCTLLQSPRRTPMVAVSYLGGGDSAFSQDPVTWAVDVP